MRSPYREICNAIANSNYSTEHKIEFGFWIWRYIATATLLVICIINPGMTTTVSKTLEDGYDEKSGEKVIN